MISTLVMLGFWAALLPVAALIGFPWTLLTGNVAFLYRMGMWGAWSGIRIAGVQAKTVGRERLDPQVRRIGVGADDPERPGRLGAG